MTTIESLGIDPGLIDRQDIAGMFVSISRKELQDAFRAPYEMPEPFETYVAGYLNALHAYHFESDSPENLPAYQNTAGAIKHEINCLSGIVFEVEDIEKHLTGYMYDENAYALVDQGISPVPRAYSMVMLDLIAEHGQLENSDN